ncbi:hypothetical protein T484DRAFT_1840456 [Baffinella frigidus]|nr:hypothetical protein T484DRAFT_1840456 [Cryptophyta sp. CCMP2293]
MENSVRIVKGEIHNVLSLMRLNRRYSSASRFHREIPATAESPLVRELKALHDSFASYSDLQDMDTLVWLRPFLDVIESSETSGPITGGALSSLSKFLLYGFIHPRSPRAAEAVGRVCRVVTRCRFERADHAFYLSPRAAEAVGRVCRVVTRCRFERTDHAGDEVVLVRILQVLLDCLRCPAGVLLTDSDVWGMVRSCYHIGRQQRLSILLQRTAEHILTQGEFDAATLGITNPSASLCAPSAPGDSDDEEGGEAGALEGSYGPSRVWCLLVCHGEDSDDEEGGDAGALEGSYGLACMHKALAFYCQLTNPGGDASVEGENDRMLGLALINVILETGGRQLSSCPALVAVLQHDLSRNLLQNSRTSNLQVLSLTLRVVFNMFNSVREHMKVQLEVFFNSIHLAESQAPENREMALESLVEFCREPRLMVDIYTNYNCDMQCTNFFEDSHTDATLSLYQVDIYTNYDCDVQCTNLFEDMCRFLSKNAFPLSGVLQNECLQCTNLFEDMCRFLSKNAPSLSGSLNALNLLSLEGLLAILRSLADACDAAGPGAQEELDSMGEQTPGGVDEDDGGFVTGGEPGGEGGDKHSVSQLRWAKQRKKRMLMAAGHFNTKPGPKGLEQVQGLDRVAIGIFLGEPSELALATLQCFVDSFDFTSVPLTEALRSFLDSFRLPGEAQKIARIVEAFAARYFVQSPGPLYNADTAYILSYAIIMLNTDLHNHQSPEPLYNADTAYILSYAIIMLNTDLHNHQVKNKMTKEQFCRMNRGINNDADLPPAYLGELFDSIYSREIKMTEDLANISNPTGGVTDQIKMAEDLANISNPTGGVTDQEPRWDDLLTSMRHKYRAPMHVGTAHGRDMFLVVWDRVIAALSVVFETTEDDRVLRRALEGLHDFAKVCAFHRLYEEFNKLIATIVKSIFKFAEAADAAAGADLDWAFVRSPKVQVAAQAMFHISFNHADCLREGWRPLLEYVAKLHRLQALPSALLERDDFVHADGRATTYFALPSALLERDDFVDADGRALSASTSSVADALLKQRDAAQDGRGLSASSGGVADALLNHRDAAQGAGGMMGFFGSLFGGSPGEPVEDPGGDKLGRRS